MIIGVKSDVGRVRIINEDDYYISKKDDLKFYLVADGMGGHKAGEVASKMAKDIVADYIFSRSGNLTDERSIFKVIKGAIEEANTKVYLKSKNQDNYEGMGTTLTLAYLDNPYIYIGHVGDSRAYIMRDKDIKQITEDHSFVDELIKSGDISEEEARSHPKKNLITRAVGSSSIIEVDLFKKEYRKGDILILLSDGVTNMLREEVLVEEINKVDDIQLACDNIIDKANKLGGLDNSTIIAIELE